MKRKSLLIRFRWPLVILFITGLLSLLTAALIERGNTFATIGVCCILASMAIASVFEMIDETTKEFE